MFDTRSNLNRHINSVHNGGSKTNKKQVKYPCRHKKCKKNFSRSDSRNRHEKTCNERKQKNIINKKKINNKNINTNGNENIAGNKKSKITVNKDNNVNIILLNYPPNNYSFVSDLGEILKSDDNLIMEIIKKTNTNKKRPEHHNIYFPDLKKSVGEIYKNNKWNPEKIDEIVNVMIENNTNCLKTYLEDLGLVIDKVTTEKIKTTCQEFYDTKSRKNLIGHIKMLLFANREMIKKTRKKTKNNKKNDDK